MPLFCKVDLNEASANVTMACDLRIVIVTVTFLSLTGGKSLFETTPHRKSQLDYLITNIVNTINHYLEKEIRFYENDIDCSNSSRCSINNNNLGDEKVARNFSGSRDKRETQGMYSLSRLLQDREETAIKTEEGRKLRLKKMVVRMILGLKILTLGLVLPGVVALSMLQSWKAVTISLLALGLAAVLGIKNIVKAASSGSSQHAATPQVVHATWPTNPHHFWRTFKVEPESPLIVAHDDHHDHSSHELAYRKYHST